MQPDIPASPDPDTPYDVPTWYLMEIYAPEVSSIELVAPGHPAVAATIHDHWAVVRSPVTSGLESPSAPTLLRLLDGAGRLRWTYDLDTANTTPCSGYLAYGVVDPCPTGTPTPMSIVGDDRSATAIPDDGTGPSPVPGG